MENNKVINIAKKGMNRTSSPDSLGEEEFSFSLNSNMEDAVGNTYGLTNESSNFLCSRLSPGFKVIKAKRDITSGRTYFFLHNPTTGVSEIGYIDGTHNVTTIEDTESECNCNFKNILDTPLELQAQLATCIYYPLMRDTCNKCLNFSLEFPIKDVVIKHERTGVKLFFSGDKNPPRNINVDNLNQYYLYSNEICDTPQVTMCSHDELCEDCQDCSECLNCDKMKVFSDFNKMCISQDAIVQGGNLKLGTYTFLAAYCDAYGNEISNYYGVTSPITIFDVNDTIMTQPELARTTNYAIKLNINGLDRQYDYYKVAVIQSTSVDGTFNAYIEGIHPTTDSTIIYTSEENKTATTFQKLAAKKPHVLRSDGLATSNGYLYQFGLQYEKEWNLQPIVSLLSAFMKWQTSIASEDLYADGVNDSLYGGHMRDEVVPFAIKFFTKDGYETAKFPLVGRPALPSDVTLVDENKDDFKSINEYAPSCDNDRIYHWQYYNTATVDAEDVNCEGLEYGDEISESSQVKCLIEVVDEVGPREYEITLPEGYTNLVNFINENIDAITDVSNPYYNAWLTSIINAAKADSDTCLGDLAGKLSANCQVNTTPLNKKTIVTTVENEELFPKPLPLSDYAQSFPPTICNIYKSGNDPATNYRIEDTTFMSTYMTAGQKVYVRNPIANSACNSALQIMPNAAQGTYLSYKGAGLLADLMDTRTSGVFPGFSANLHKNAVWFKFNFGTASDSILEVSLGSVCDDPILETGFLTGRRVRVSTYLNCSNLVAPAIESFVVDIDSGGLIKLNQALYGQSNIFVAIDSIVRPGAIGYILEPPCGCFGVTQRPVEFTTTKIKFNRIVISNEYTYEITCTYRIPLIDKCRVAPFRHGKFGYWESIENYPCNSELFDSSVVKVNKSKLIDPNNGVQDIESDFVTYFTSGGVVDADGNYILDSTKTDLQGKPIRHFKMPSNEVAPFMSSNSLPGFRESAIFPLGVKLDNKIINFFLDVAVDSNLITSEQRNRIDGYEIFRGDRTLDKGIVAKGLLYDMYSYRDDAQKDVLYSNYPYNTLGVDPLHVEIADGRTQIQHPFNSESNNRFTFHSPDTHFGARPALPTEIANEGVQFGKARGSFREVEDYPKYVVLGEDAYALATTLAIVEEAFETAMILGQAALDAIEAYYIAVGTSSGVNIVGIAVGIATAIAFTVATTAMAVVKTGRLRYEWLTIFRDHGKPTNLSYYHTSEGFYNYFNATQKVAHEGNLVRGLDMAKYLKPGRFTFVNTAGTNLNINNVDRESSVFLSLGKYDYSYLPSEYVPDYQSHDNSATLFPSRHFASSSGRCDSLADFDSNIASPYVALKNYLPAQYGGVEDVRWISTGYCGRLANDNTCETIYGGDTKISRFSLKRKLPMFLANAMGLANQTPFAHSLHHNIAKSRFYADFDVELSTSFAKAIFPDIGSEYNFDCHPSQKKFYIKNPSKYYLFYYGIPQFLVESEINCNYRWAGKTPKEWHYPNGGASDYHFWTQEKNVSIKNDNVYNYNFAYSRNLVNFGNKILPANYNKYIWDKLADCPNCVMASVQDINEQGLTDPWLIYKPFDFYQFPTTYGKLIDLLPVGSLQIMARFENQFNILNSVDILRERLTDTNKELGTGIFGDARPIELAIGNLGYAGTQHKVSESCEYGFFFPDARRGQIFNVPTNAKGLFEISAFKRDGSENGMRSWFAEHLPFKILNGVKNLTDLDVDNAYNQVGLAMVWDARYKRLFITKIDYVVNDVYKNAISYIDGKFYWQVFEEPDVLVELTDTEYFTNASWTISYSPILDGWLSYYSFKPNYYIGHNGYFQSGVNTSIDDTELGLWSHNLSDKSFQVFYGKKYPWIIEVAQKDKYANTNLRGIEYWMDVKRYHDNHSYALNRTIGMNKAYVYNHNNNSGLLNLVPAVKNDLSQILKYPRVNGVSTDILATNFENKWTFNAAYNKVKNDVNNVPIFLNDVNNIMKTINPLAMEYRLDRWQDRLRGDWFLVRLEQDVYTSYKMMFKWAFFKTNV